MSLLKPGKSLRSTNSCRDIICLLKMSRISSIDVAKGSGYKSNIDTASISGIGLSSYTNAKPSSVLTHLWSFSTLRVPAFIAPVPKMTCSMIASFILPSKFPSRAWSSIASSMFSTLLSVSSASSVSNSLSLA